MLAAVCLRRGPRFPLQPSLCPSLLPSPIFQIIYVTPLRALSAQVERVLAKTFVPLCARCLPPFLVPYSARREACSVRLASQDIGNAFPASSGHHSRQRSQGLPSGCRSSAIHAAVHGVLAQFSPPYPSTTMPPPQTSRFPQSPPAHLRTPGHVGPRPSVALQALHFSRLRASL
jgi:hypothetical protein